MPIHGEYHMLVNNAKIAENVCGIPRDNIFVCDPGDIIEMSENSAEKAGRINIGTVMYDNVGKEVSKWF